MTRLRRIVRRTSWWLATLFADANPEESKEEQTGVSSCGASGACRFSKRRGGRRDQEALCVRAHRCRG